MTLPVLNHFRRPRPASRSRWLDRGLALLRPSWQAAPLRRLVQACFFLLFLYLFFYVSWPYGEPFHAELLSSKEYLPAELPLLLDPLVGISATIAARAVGIALMGCGIVLAISLFIPRGFCSYACPLGTILDLFEGCMGRWVRGKNGASAGWWRHLKYYLLAAVLVAAAFQVMIAGYVSAIPVVTRAMAFLLAPLQLGTLRNWSQVREVGWAEWLSIGLFASIILASLFRQRFWCRYVCPSGAVFSLVAKVGLTGRHVTDGCVECGRCADVCPFDAVDEDFTTRGLDCAWCQTCGGACPAGAIQFTLRGRREGLKEGGEDRSKSPSPSRRGFLAAGIGAVAVAIGLRSARGTQPAALAPIRPPGSRPEAEFLAMCVRCGQCYQVCPGPVLRPSGLEGPVESLWTPVADLLHAGCHQDCNFCTQVCPTGAIRSLTIYQKRRTPMGIAVIDDDTCLAHQGAEFCRLCADECDAAGYGAIEMRTIELAMEDVPEGLFSDEQLEAMGHTEAPFVNADACVGCGLCQYRCHAALVKQRKELDQAAIAVQALKRER